MTLRDLLKTNKDLDTVQIHTNVTIFGHNFNTNLGSYDVKYADKPYVDLIDCKVPLDVEVQAWWCTSIRCLVVIIKGE